MRSDKSTCKDDSLQHVASFYVWQVFLGSFSFNKEQKVGFETHFQKRPPTPRPQCIGKNRAKCQLTDKVSGNFSIVLSQKIQNEEF